MNGVLRPYQVAAVTDLRSEVRRHGSVVYVLPTGGGKTVVAAEIARLGAAKGSRTLLLVHRRELVRQAVDTLTEAVPEVPVGVEAAGWPSHTGAPLQVGMVQSIVRRQWDVRPNIVIIDEAHHARAATWEKVLARWPDAARVGLTATPQRGDRKGLGEHFASMVMGPTIRELVADGWLAPVRTLTVPVGLDLAGLRVDRHGEHRPGDVDERITPSVVAAAGAAYARHAAGRRAIFFAVTRRHSRSVVTDLRNRGWRAEHVDGTDPPGRRDRIMSEFRDGAIDVVSNVSLIDEGFDAPACDVVMLGSPTRSVTRYLQQAGRCMRPGEGKTALVLDLAGVAHLLGLPDEEREWSLADGEIVERSDERPEPRTCPECATVFRGATCPHCGHVVGMPRQVREVDAELVDASSLRRRPADPARQAARRAALSAAIRAGTESDALQILVDYGERAGYARGWAHRTMRSWVIPTRRTLQRQPRVGTRR